MTERQILGRETWPALLPPIYRNISIVNRRSGGTETLHIQPPMGELHPFCSAISETLRESIRYAPGFMQHRASERPRLFDRNNQLDIYRTLTSPDLMFAAKATADSTFLNIPAGYVATRFNLHRFPRSSWEDHTVAELVNLSVSPEFQGHNLGHELLNLAEERAKEFGITTMVAEVPEGFVSWLTREGFTPVGNQHLFAGSSTPPLIYMEKSLGLPQGVSPAVNMPQETYAKIGIAGMAALQFQYDLPVSEWRGQGNEMNPNRQLFWHHLQPHIVSSLDQDSLDVGGGMGWLSDLVLSYGGNPTCMEPSKRNVQEGRKAHPEVEFVNTNLQAFDNGRMYDIAYAVLVDNFIDLEQNLRKIGHLLKPKGKFITIISDFDRTVRGRSDYQVETERIPGATAVHIHYPGKYGDLWVIARTIDSYVHSATLAGLNLQRHTPIYAEQGHPHYGKIADPLFHMLEFTH
jgi:GNAT superfamily N-acetyltransferase